MKPKILQIGLMVDNPRHGFQIELEKVSSEYREINCGTPDLEHKVREICRWFKFDICFIQVQAQNIISAQLAYDLGKIGFTINWTGDVRGDGAPVWMKMLGADMHLTCFSNLRDVLDCRREGIKSEWIECGFEPEIYRFRNDPHLVPPIVAHFNDYQEQFPLSSYRRDIVQRLRAEFGPLFGVYGNFPGANGNWSRQEDEARALSGAKIAINCSHFAILKYSSDRLSRITGTGGALALSHEIELLEEMYPGGCIATFRDLDHLVEQCKFYLNNEEERKRMVKAAQKHALENYTFQKMSERIVELYHEYKNNYE